MLLGAAGDDLCASDRTWLRQRLEHGDYHEPDIHRFRELLPPALQHILEPTADADEAGLITNTPSIRCAHWQPLRRGALLGYAAIELVAYGVTVNSVPIFTEADGTLRAGVPSHPLISSNGALILKGGKPSRGHALAFTDEATRECFLRAAVAALVAKFPTGLPTANGGTP